MNIAEPLIRIENRLESLLNDFKGLKEDLNKVNQSLDNIKTATEHKKKYRPFTGIEFAEKFDLWVGHIIRIRDLFDNAGQEYEYKIMFVGYRWYKGIFEVFINGCWIDLVTLFKLYEYQEDGEWHPFGVEE